MGCPENTSKSRNLTFNRPSEPSATDPVTSACALIAFQSA